MLSQTDQSIARRLKRELLQITPLVKLVVYGSRARGDSSLESDLDIYLEVPEITPEIRKKISEAAWRIGFKNGIIISTFVVTPKDIEEGAAGANPLVKAVETEGIPV